MSVLLHGRPLEVGIDAVVKFYHAAVCHRDLPIQASALMRQNTASWSPSMEQRHSEQSVRLSPPTGKGTAADHQDLPARYGIESESMVIVDRETIRATAGRMLRSDTLETGERDDAAEFLRGHLTLGNPHMVRCDWCKETVMLFRDEDMGNFAREGRGWHCTKCDEHAQSQEVRF